MRGRYALLILLLPVFPLLGQPADDMLDQALAAAKARESAVLVDLYAPWCYSCYYMSRNVLTGPEWAQVKQRTVVLDLDVDAPEGARYRASWNVRAIPSYVVLDGQGQELGRILGEQTREDFYARLNEILDRGETLDALRAQAAAGDVAAAREALRTSHARVQASDGLNWFAQLPRAQRARLEADEVAALWLQRLQLMQAGEQGETDTCLSAGAAVLAADLGCERAYELNRVLACTADSDGPARQSLLRGQRPAMDRLLAAGVFADSGRCADERSVVFAAEALARALGQADEADALLVRAAADARERLGESLTADRNLADNLRVYLERAGNHDALDGLMPALVAAYREDYVYAYRHARSLAQRGRHAEALPYFERAADKAYGINRLRNAELHAKSLQALDRPDEARRILAAALKANGPWFPDDAQALRRMLAEGRNAP
jgi:thioredoxin-like negative regulator of GroEL